MEKLTAPFERVSANIKTRKVKNVSNNFMDSFTQTRTRWAITATNLHNKCNVQTCHEGLMEPVPITWPTDTQIGLTTQDTGLEILNSNFKRDLNSDRFMHTAHTSWNCTDMDLLWMNSSWQQIVYDKSWHSNWFEQTTDSDRRTPASLFHYTSRCFEELFVRVEDLTSIPLRHLFWNYLLLMYACWNKLLLVLLLLCCWCSTNRYFLIFAHCLDSESSLNSLTAFFSWVWYRFCCLCIDRCIYPQSSCSLLSSHSVLSKNSITEAIVLNHPRMLWWSVHQFQDDASNQFRFRLYLHM